MNHPYDVAVEKKTTKEDLAGNTVETGMVKNQCYDVILAVPHRQVCVQFCSLVCKRLIQTAKHAE